MADLMTAKTTALTRSKEVKKMVFVDIDNEGECEIKEKQSKQSVHAFLDGAEIELPPFVPTVEKPAKVAKAKLVVVKNKKKMAEKKAPAKKAAKKVAKTPAKKAPANPNGIAKATTLVLTKGQWEKLGNIGNIRASVAEAVIKFHKL